MHPDNDSPANIDPSTENTAAVNTDTAKNNTPETDFSVCEQIYKDKLVSPVHTEVDTTPECPDDEVNTVSATPNSATPNCETHKKEVRQYHRQSLRLSLWDSALDLVVLSVCTFLLAEPVGNYLISLPIFTNGHNTGLGVSAVLVLFTIFHSVISFPLTYYSGFVVEHKFKLSRQTFGRWLSQYLKRLGLVLIFDTGLMLILFYLIVYGGVYWVPIAAAVFFFVNIIASILLPFLIPLFYKLERLENEELLTRLGKLVKPTSLAISGIYRVCLSNDTVKVNAMLAGLGATRRVILADTLLNKFNPDEIEVVFAHEVGHHVHRHIMKLIPLILLLSVGAFYVCDIWLRYYFTSPSGDAFCGYGHLPIWSIIGIKLILTLVFMFFEPLVNFFSRHFERQADAYALAHCDPTAYIHTFLKLAMINKAELYPPAWEVFLFDSHPSLGQRIGMADKTLATLCSEQNEPVQ